MAKNDLALCLVFAIGLIGCSGYEGPDDTNSGIISAFYSMGGPAPLTGFVTVSEHGNVAVRNLAGTVMRRPLSRHPSFKKLIASLARPEFAEELAVLDAKRHEDLCYDCEMLYVETAGREVTVWAAKADELTPAVRQVLEQLDALALAVMQHRLDFQLNIEQRAA